ncbi:hypothetical protein GCM10009677_43850 [Sphaerisporangium rubeum]|uniref:Uncharacterized protein n=1 Tax=Sphaerisporangium rubeum TaxID=321317 RepID=A0A7X0MAX7_9ACTN|nr:hypothetical protein [Sphaerisporangium rubeum]
MQQPSSMMMAGVLVTLALFVLIGYVVRTLSTSTHTRLAGVLAAIASLIIAFPAVLYALYGG